jgi:hypothetical protein
MQKTMWIDDLDNDEEAVETVTFALDGQKYEIDLGKKNVDQLRSFLGTFMAGARRIDSPEAKSPTPAPAVKRKARTRKTPTPAIPVANNDEMRAWAQANGVKVAARGRISKEVQAAYRTAQGT